MPFPPPPGPVWLPQPGASRARPGAAVAEGADRPDVRRVSVGGADTKHPGQVRRGLNRTAFVADRRNNAQTALVR